MQTLSDLLSSPDRENMRSNCGLSMQYSDLVLINKAWSNLSASLKQLYSLIGMYFISWLTIRIYMSVHYRDHI